MLNLITEYSELLRYRVQHERGNSISLSTHVLFTMYYLLNNSIGFDNMYLIGINLLGNTI